MKTRKVILRILSDCKPIAGWLVLGVIIIIASIAISLLCPMILGDLTDMLYAYGVGEAGLSLAKIGVNCLILAGLYGLSALFSIASVTLMNNVVSRHFTAGLRIKISDKITRLPVSFVDGTQSGEVISRMTGDVSAVGNSIHEIINVIVRGFVQLVAITVLLFVLNPALAAVIVVFVPLSLALSAVIAGKSQKHHRATRERNGKLYAFAEEDFTGFETVKVFNMEEKQNAAQFTLCKQQEEVAKKARFIDGLVQPLIALINNFSYIVICILGGWLVIYHGLNVGMVLAFVMYARMYSGPLESIASGLTMTQSTVAAARRVYEILDMEEITEPARAALPQCEGRVEFKNVSFSYDKKTPIIKNFSFTANAGQKIAIVGPTGGGKTTIVNLLMRFYELDGGEITVDGRDISKMNRADLRDMFAMVLQDTWLFSGSVYENIAYGKPDATREEVLAAAKSAHVDYFIDSLENGYDTLINEDSGNISGGQKQLLTIARAYLSDRKMLILDEATSNVDTRLELIIQKTMDSLMQGRTSFVIAHRLSTILDADVILVVRDGEIVEKGKHTELLKKGGFYAEIYNSQYDGQSLDLNGAGVLL